MRVLVLLGTLLVGWFGWAGSRAGVEALSSDAPQHDDGLPTPTPPFPERLE